MSPGDRSGSSPESRLERLVEECRPELEEFLARSPLSRNRTDGVLLDTLTYLSARWDRFRDHRRILFETLERFLQLDMAREGPPVETEGPDRLEEASPEGDPGRDGVEGPE